MHGNQQNMLTALNINSHHHQMHEEVCVCVCEHHFPSLLACACSVVSDSWQPMDCSLPGSSVHGIHQARVLEWVAISYPKGSSQLRAGTQASCTEGRSFTAKPLGKPFPSLWDLYPPRKRFHEQETLIFPLTAHMVSIIEIIKGKRSKHLCKQTKKLVSLLSF